jgi:protein-tyrosine phosphatase
MPDFYEKPVPSSYWVMPGKFLAGSYPGSVFPGRAKEGVAALVNAGIQVFIDLTEADELVAYAQHLELALPESSKRFSYHRMPITDHEIPSVEQMVATLDLIDAALAENRPVYVHCLAGIGRTGTVVGCWLARHGTTGQDALDKLDALRRTARVDLGMSWPGRQCQIEMIDDWLPGQ